jgi:hypothetical protein
MRDHECLTGYFRAGCDNRRLDNLFLSNVGGVD